ncbi:hypothetical protein BC835DRAFT_1418724 [Cytidiella melzeri]|nr:hypothetical protein BC835DRAFT_1418724 [Cytidiella melzeri]
MLSVTQVTTSHQSGPNVDDEHISDAETAQVSVGVGTEEGQQSRSGTPQAAGEDTRDAPGHPDLFYVLQDTTSEFEQSTHPADSEIELTGGAQTAQTGDENTYGAPEQPDLIQILPDTTSESLHSTPSVDTQYSTGAEINDGVEAESGQQARNNATQAGDEDICGAPEHPDISRVLQDKTDESKQSTPAVDS